MAPCQCFRSNNNNMYDDSRQNHSFPPVRRHNRSHNRHLLPSTDQPNQYQHQHSQVLIGLPTNLHRDTVTRHAQQRQRRRVHHVNIDVPPRIPPPEERPPHPRRHQHGLAHVLRRHPHHHHHHRDDWICVTMMMNLPLWHI